MLADLHLHSLFSDGSDTAEELLCAVQKAGLSAFALTDHDTDEGNALLKKRTPPSIRFIPGIEFTCIMPLGKCHILGYGFDETDPTFREAIEEGKKRRREKLLYRLSVLKEAHGIVFTEQELNSLYALSVVGKPHIAALLVNRGMAQNISDAIEKYMNHGKIRAKDRLDADYAINAIRSAGGLAVWAHPLGGEQEKHLNEDELNSRLYALKSMGIDGMECFYSRYSAEESALLVRAAEANGLLISGGSDYHGKNKDIAMGTLSSDGSKIESSKLSLLSHL